MLLVRGVALWLLVPIVVISYPVVRATGMQVSLGQALGWVDLNLIAVLQRAFTWRVFPEPVRFARWHEMPSVTHRIRAVDPA